MNAERNGKPPFLPRELAAVTGNLAELLARETRAVSAMRFQDAVALKDEKSRLTRIYRAAIEELRAGRVSLRQITAAERELLVAAAARLAEVCRENELALRAGRAAIERIVAAIARTVNAKRRSLASYAPPRHAPPRLRSIGGGIAVDQRL
jgi:hypothetical protein